MNAIEVSEKSSIKKLNGKDYPAWAREIRWLLLERELWYGVTVKSNEESSGKEQSTDAPSKSATIETKQVYKAMSIIGRHVERDYQDLIAECQSAKEMWDTLEKYFMGKSAATKDLLRKQIEQQELATGELAMGANRIRTLYRQLKELGDDTSEAQVVTAVIRKLPDDYQVLKQVWMARPDSELYMDALISTLITHDQEHMINETTGGSGTALSANKKGKEKGRKFKGKCFFCDKVGHRQSECFKKKNSSTSKENAQVAKGYAENDGRVDEIVCLMATQKESTMNEWIIDSGASVHMTFMKNRLKNLKPLDKAVEINVAKKGDKLMATMKGDIEFKKGGRIIKFSDVLFVTDLKFNLLSIPALVRKGCSVKFKDMECQVLRNKELLFNAKKKNGLFKLTALVAADTDTKDLVHSRLGHLSKSTIDKAIKSGSVTGVSIDESITKCSERTTCLEAKMPRTNFDRTNEGARSSSMFELIHSDVIGPMEVESLTKKRFIVVFKDDFTGFVFASAIRNKSDVCSVLRNILAQLKTNFDVKPKILRTDNGGEYVASSVKELLNANGITHVTTAPYTPQQNAIAERYNRILMETVRALLKQCDLPKCLWEEALEALGTEVYIHNRVMIRSGQDRSPYYLVFGKPADISDLKVFGCVVQMKIPDKTLKGKLESRSVKGIHVGKTPNGYKVFIPSERKIYVSRDLVFREDKKSKDQNELSNEEVYTFDIIHEREPSTVNDKEKTARSSNQEKRVQPSRGAKEKVTSYKEGDEELEEEPEYHTSDEKEHDALLSQSTHVEDEPNTLEEAMRGKDKDYWIEALKDEYDALQTNETFKIATLPKGRKALPCRIVFKKKMDADGNLDRCKCRAVVKGYAQEEGRDYFELFSPVVKEVTMRILLALATHMEWNIHHVDIKTAFLNGHLDEEIYMIPPPMYFKLLNLEEPKDGKVLKLIKSLYGLRQAPRCWNIRLSKFIISLGFIQMKTDYCLFKNEINGKLFVILCYVDDLLIMGPERNIIEDIKKKFAEEFKTTDLGELKFITGKRVIRNRESKQLKIIQDAYIDKVLRKFDMHNAKSINTPGEHGYRLSKALSPKNDIEANMMASVPYKAVVGSIGWLAKETRPDLSFSFCQVSKYMANPGAVHWSLARRILRYIKGTSTKGLTYDGNHNFTPICYADADFANDSDTRRSQSGYIILMCGLKLNEPTTIYQDNMGTIAIAKNPEHHQKTKHIDIKYYFVREAVQNGIIKLKYCETRSMLADMMTTFIPRNLLLHHRKLIGLVGVDSSAKNPEHHQKTKHIDIKYYFVREAVQNGIIKLKYCETRSMLADMMTKFIPRNLLLHHRKLIGLVGVDSSGGSIEDSDEQLVDRDRRSGYNAV
ncbi:hypothetical protein MP638_000785 [Amoeboaphelidium occidentale]|nr:hypothetical protein MP638_000785 [Amoeboaphelidium occidentale]